VTERDITPHTILMWVATFAICAMLIYVAAGGWR
jgi:hypothetical protein